MTLKPDEIQQILTSLEGSSWDSAVVTVDDVTISVARNGAALPGGNGGSSPSGNAASVAAPAPVTTASASAAPVAAPAAVPPAATPAVLSEGEITVIAPSVGVFWRSPQPGAPAFVEVGTTVTKGDTVCIVEVMKLMSNVASPVTGVVTAVHVENAAAVEYGTVLFSIRPSGA